MRKRKGKVMLLTLLIIILFTSIIVAQNQKKVKVIQKTLLSDTINVPADSLWVILRAFDKVAHWTSELEHSEGVGQAKFEGATCNKRVCLQDGKKLVEELTMFSDEKRELAYELREGAPGFVKLAKNHWRVIEISPNQSKVQMDVTIHLSKFMGFFLGGIITKTMTKKVGIVLDELKIYAETGEVSEAKKRQLNH
ncbi:MAG: hypothetical protein COA50_06005 [Flavobacteriaceae bacterium]|nr:MAG: hypothetical protein COA50_06005 [Flavobacteriaceae bacterium]